MKTWELTPHGKALCQKWRDNNPNCNQADFDCQARINTVEDAAGFYLDREGINALEHVSAVINFGADAFWRHIDAAALKAELEKCIIEVPYNYGQNRCYKCGSYAKVRSAGTSLCFEVYDVCCMNPKCGMKTSREHIFRNDAVREWNRKPSLLDLLFDKIFSKIIK